MSYGPVVMDFSPLGDWANTFFKARRDAEDHAQKREIRTTLASLGQGNVDYDTIGNKLLSLGELSGGLGFKKLAQEERARGAQAAADREVLGLLNGGSTSPTYTPSAGTPRANIDRNTVHVAENEDDVQRLERAMGQNITPDLDKVVRTVYGEAGNQGAIGQSAVANVIANRAQQSGMTPTDIVLAKGQFEPWSNPAARARMERLDPNSEEYKQIAGIVAPALTGQGADPTGGATHFYAPKAQAALGRNAPSWDDGTGRDIGDHRFFNHGYAPQGRVQVAQADIPASGAQNAQGFVVPGQGGQAQSPAIANLERALLNPNISDGARKALQARLDREYKREDEAGKKTELQRNYDTARSQGFQGSIVDYQLAIKKAGATNVNVDTKGETEFAKKAGQKVAERYSGLLEAADAAQSQLGDLENMRQLSRVIGSQGGTANLKLALAPFAESAGINIEGIDDLQAFSAVLSKIAPTMRPAGSGATSDFEFKQFLNALPQAAQNPAAREMIIDTMEGMARYKLEQGQIASAVLNGEIERGEAERRLRALGSPMETFRQFQKDNPDMYREMLKKSRQTTPQNAPAIPAPGTVQQGYRFKGGNPADPSSWEKAQ